MENDDETHKSPVQRPLLANHENLAGAQIGGQLGIVALQGGHGGMIRLGYAAQGLTLLDCVVLRGGWA